MSTRGYDVPEGGSNGRKGSSPRHTHTPVGIPEEMGSSAAPSAAVDGAGQSHQSHASAQLWSYRIVADPAFCVQSLLNRLQGQPQVEHTAVVQPRDEQGGNN